MSLTDPELDLLLELLGDDPADEVFLQVGEELVRRQEFGAAADVLRGGLAANPQMEEGYALLARAALESGDYDETLAAWERAPSLHGSAEFGRLRILAFERAGRTTEARDAVVAFERDHQGVDVVVEAAKERLEAPPVVQSRATNDPWITARRAERYAAIGRIDRALRTYRRILHHHPDDISVRARLMSLDDDATVALDDFTDLSEELGDPNHAPPMLSMPGPAITSASVKPAPARGVGPIPGTVPSSNMPTPRIDNVRPDRASPFDNEGEADTEIDDSSDSSSDDDNEVFVDADDGPIYTPPIGQTSRPEALSRFIEDARRAERGEPETADAELIDEPTEELPGLEDLGMAPRKRKRRRSLLKR